MGTPMGIQLAAPWLAACIAATPRNPIRAALNVGLSAALRIALSATLSAAHAQGTPPGLREAVEAAWLRQPRAAAQDMRAEEFAARKNAAEAWLPGPPALSGEHSTDALLRNQGARKFVGEIAVPLWLPGQRERAQAVVAADRSGYEATTAAAKLKLAGEVREAYWQAHADAAEVVLARAAQEALAALEGDVKRRSAAGELARIDANRAEAETQLQRLTLAEAEGRAYRSAQVFRALTGWPRLPALMPALTPLLTPVPGVAGAVGASGADANRIAARAPLHSHPALQAAAQQIESAQARLRQSAGDTRDAPEIGIGTTRERGDAIKPWEQSVTLRVRVPLGSDNRNRPRVAAANAELMEAQALRNQLAAQLEGEAAAAARELEIAGGALPLALRRSALARDTQALLARGFAAGEFDVVARLRAERDLREAELAEARAHLAASRAVSRLQHAYGVLP